MKEEIRTWLEALSSRLDKLEDTVYFDHRMCRRLSYLLGAGAGFILGYLSIVKDWFVERLGS